MKLILPLTALSMLLTACSSPTDSHLKQQLVGAWTGEVDGHPYGLVQNNADTTFIMSVPRGGTEQGIWRVKDGYFIGTVTNTTWPGEAPPEVRRFKIASIDDRKMVLLLGKEGTNQCTLHKQ